MIPDIAGKRVCLKGKFTGYRQPQLKAALTSLGAKMSKLDRSELLFAGDGASFYTRWADNHGVAVYGEDALIALVGNVDLSPPPPKKKAPEVAPGPVVESALTGRHVVVASKLATLNKANAQRLLAQAGATVQSKVGGTTDLVVHNRMGFNGQYYDATRARLPEMTEEALIAELRRVGIGADELADADAALAKHDKALLAKHGRGIRAARKIQAAHIERWGMSLGTLLHTYLRAFARRPDVHVTDQELSGPGSAATQCVLHNKFPRWAMALVDEIGRTRFRWVFADEVDADPADGLRGGLLHLPAIDRLTWHPRPEGWDGFTYEADVMVDTLKGDASTYLRYQPGQKPTEAVLVFDDTDNPTPFADWEAYLTRGAKAGFAWYWQNGRPELGIVDRLTAASLPRSTPEAEVRAGLQRVGLTEAEARGIVAWLGQDAVVLLPRAD